MKHQNGDCKKQPKHFVRENLHWDGHPVPFVAVFVGNPSVSSSHILAGSAATLRLCTTPDCLTSIAAKYLAKKQFSQLDANTVLWNYPKNILECVNLF